MLSRRCQSLRPLLCRLLSSRASPQEVATTEKIELSRPSVTKWKRPPFLKNIFRGKFDTELLAFPEILSKDQLNELEFHVANVSLLMQQRVDSRDIDEKKEIPESVLHSLKAMGLFGRTIPAKYGGLDLTYTACMRLGEALSLDWSVSSVLAVHEFLATQVILQFGSEDQKSRFLPKLASGDLIAAFCCAEFNSGSDLLSMEACVSDPSSSNLLLNGSKAWVANGNCADLFVVFAKTPSATDPREVSVFLVERGQEGVQVTPQEKVGLRGLSTATVHFDEVVIPSSNIIGSFGNGYPVYLKAQESFRIASSTISFGALKALFGTVVNTLTGRERCQRSLADYECIRAVLSQVQARIYALESVAYFAAAILDSTENPDVQLEAAALKLLSGSWTVWCLDQLAAVLGSCSLVPGAMVERLSRDARVLSLMDSPNDMCSLYIGLKGCQEVGRLKQEEIMQVRNPLYFPKEVTKRAFRLWRIRKGWFKFEQDLAGYIHPSLTEWANDLERKVQLFEGAVEDVLAENGKKVVEVQLEPVRLGVVAAELFAWAAVLSRSSRSYCIGLTNSHHEIRLVDAYCFDASLRVDKAIDEVFAGVALNNDRNHYLLGEQVVDMQGYFPEHPLKHNF